MATVLAVYNGAACLARCDSRCHDAKGGECKCICGGALHGVGARIAAEDAFESLGWFQREWRKRGKVGELVCGVDGKQMELFG